MRSTSKRIVHWTGIPSLASSTVPLGSRTVPGNATRAPPGRATLEETRGWGIPHTQSCRGDSGPGALPLYTGILVTLTLVHQYSGKRRVPQTAPSINPGPCFHRASGCGLGGHWESRATPKTPGWSHALTVRDSVSLRTYAWSPIVAFVDTWCWASEQQGSLRPPQTAASSSLKMKIDDVIGSSCG